jgi:hypothetical protein
MMAVTVCMVALLGVPLTLMVIGRAVTPVTTWYKWLKLPFALQSAGYKHLSISSQQLHAANAHREESSPPLLLILPSTPTKDPQEVRGNELRRWDTIV